MPSLYNLKPAFQNLLRPGCHHLAKTGVTANQVTLTAVFLSLGMGITLALQPTNPWLLFSFPVVLLLRMALNAIDGMLAREYHMQTSLGVILNELGDVIADAGLYLPFALLPHVLPFLVVFVVLLSTFSEMTGVLAMQIGASRRYDGPLGKSDRAFVFGAIALLLAVGVPPGHWLNVTFGIIASLLILTIFNRAYRALKHV